MLKKIWEINRRELEKLKNNKKAFLFLFFVPVIYTLLFGFLYSPHVVNNITTGIINQSPSQLSRTIAGGFEKSPRFHVSYYLDDESSGRDLLNKGEIDVLVMIPEGFTEKIKTGERESILVGVNGSNSIIGNSASSSALEIIKTYSAGVTLKVYEASGLSESEAMSAAIPVASSFRSWFNPQYSYVNYLLLGIVAVALQQIILMSAANSFSREREEGSFGEMLDKGYGIYEIAIGKGSFYFVSGMFSLVTTLFLSFQVFNIPLRGNIFWIFFMGIFFYIAVIAGSLIIALYCKNQTESIQISMLLAYPTFLLSGYTWPERAMPEGLVWIGKLFPLTYFGENVRNVALVGSGFQELKMDILALIILSLFYVCLAFFMYRRRLVREGYQGLVERG